jgi:hypothetical protein
LLFRTFKSIPANTAATTPDKEKLTVCKGTIKQWIIFFDPEAADMLHVRVEYHGSSIMPFGGKDWILGFFSDNPFNDNVALDSPPYELDIYAYNEDDTFEHEYYIHPIIIRDKPFTLPETQPSAIERFMKYITGE